METILNYLKGELINKEINCLGLDNTMIENNFYSEIDSFSRELLESGTILYTPAIGHIENHIRIEFTPIILAEESEESILASYVKINNIEWQ